MEYHLALYDTFTSRVKQSSNGQLYYGAWRFRIFDESHQYNTKNHTGWQIAMNAKIGFKLQVTATLGHISFYDLCYWTMWLFSGAPDDTDNATVIE